VQYSAGGGLLVARQTEIRHVSFVLFELILALIA